MGFISFGSINNTGGEEKKPTISSANRESLTLAFKHKAVMHSALLNTAVIDETVVALRIYAARTTKRFLVSPLISE